jgi:hypothetical protein
VDRVKRCATQELVEPRQRDSLALTAFGDRLTRGLGGFHELGRRQQVNAQDRPSRVVGNPQCIVAGGERDGLEGIQEQRLTDDHILDGIDLPNGGRARGPVNDDGSSLGPSFPPISGVGPPRSNGMPTKRWGPSRGMTRGVTPGSRPAPLFTLGPPPSRAGSSERRRGVDGAVGVAGSLAAQKALEIGRGHRPSEQVALPARAVRSTQGRDLIGRLDALGDAPEP